MSSFLQELHLSLVESVNEQVYCTDLWLFTQIRMRISSTFACVVPKQVIGYKINERVKTPICLGGYYLKY